MPLKTIFEGFHILLERLKRRPKRLKRRLKPPRRLKNRRFLRPHAIPYMVIRRYLKLAEF